MIPIQAACLFSKGNTDIRTKLGDANTADGDFDALNPADVTNK